MTISVTRQQLVHILVLSQIADTYCHLERAIDQVTRLGLPCGVTLEASEIVAELNSLVDTNLAKAYRLSELGREFNEIAGWPPADEVEHCYFTVTAAGEIEIKATGYLWPFDFEHDDEDVLREGWTLI